MTYATPAHAPMMITRMIVTTRFGIRAVTARGTEANMIDTPNSRFRENPRNAGRPRDMPIARPKKIAANAAPHPALPPASTFVM